MRARTSTERPTECPWPPLAEREAIKRRTQRLEAGFGTVRAVDRFVGAPLDVAVLIRNRPSVWLEIVPVSVAVESDAPRQPGKPQAGISSGHHQPIRPKLRHEG